MEQGWLLEKREDGKILWLMVHTGMGIFGWTEDSTKALRLSRRQDGDALAEIVDDADAITEHQWG